MGIPFVLEYGQEEETHSAKQHPLGAHARTPDNRRFYYSQAQEIPLFKGSLVAAPIIAEVEQSLIPGGPKEKVRKAVTRIGICPSDVKPNEYFWCQTWGPGEALFDWMSVQVDVQEAMRVSGVLGWCWDQDEGNWRFMYMTTAA